MNFQELPYDMKPRIFAHVPQYKLYQLLNGTFSERKAYRYLHERVIVSESPLKNLKIQGDYSEKMKDEPPDDPKTELFKRWLCLPNVNSLILFLRANHPFVPRMLYFDDYKQLNDLYDAAPDLFKAFTKFSATGNVTDHLMERPKFDIEPLIFGSFMKFYEPQNQQTEVFPRYTEHIYLGGQVNPKKRMVCVKSITLECPLWEKISNSFPNAKNLNYKSCAPLDTDILILMRIRELHAPQIRRVDLRHVFSLQKISLDASAGLLENGEISIPPQTEDLTLYKVKNSEVLEKLSTIESLKVLRVCFSSNYAPAKFKLEVPPILEELKMERLGSNRREGQHACVFHGFKTIPGSLKVLSLKGTVVPSTDFSLPPNCETFENKIRRFEGKPAIELQQRSWKRLISTHEIKLKYKKDLELFNQNAEVVDIVSKANYQTAPNLRSWKQDFKNSGHSNHIQSSTEEKWWKGCTIKGCKGGDNLRKMTLDNCKLQTKFSTFESLEFLCFKNMTVDLDELPENVFSLILINCQIVGEVKCNENLRLFRLENCHLAATDRRLIILNKNLEVLQFIGIKFHGKETFENVNHLKRFELDACEVTDLSVDFSKGKLEKFYLRNSGIPLSVIKLPASLVEFEAPTYTGRHFNIDKCTKLPVDQ